MTKKKYFVIIGNGIAGNSAESAIRRYDHAASITLISDERQPLYSPCAFHKFLGGEMEQGKLFLKKFEDYFQEGIRVIFGEKVSEVDLKTGGVYVGDERIPFDKLIIATGGKVMVPRIKGGNKRGVFNLKTMGDAEKVFHYPAKRVAIIGSGPIGVEAGIALRKKGLEIYIVEIFDRILPRLFDEKAANLLRGIMENYGITVLTGEEVVEVLGKEVVESLVTNKREFNCEMVIIATGVQPNVDIARQLGLEIGGLGGIKTNDYMMTSTENIYACGDCVESKDIITGETVLSLLWRNAKRQGWISGCNCAEKRSRFTGSFNATSIEILGTYAISAGIGSTSFSHHKVEMVEKVFNSTYYKLIMRDNRLVGFQLLNRGEHAGLMFSKMVRKDKILELAKGVSNDKLLSIIPWNYWIRQYNLLGKEVMLI